MRLLRANALEAVLSSQFDTKNLRKGVKGILTCPLWLQIYVSIVHSRLAGVNRYVLYRKRALCTYEVLLIFPRFFDKFKCDILRHLCYKGALHDLIKIYDRFEWSVAPGNDVRSLHNYAFIYACMYGHLDVAQWLYTTFQRTFDDVRDIIVFRLACSFGHLDVAKWLFTVFQLTAADARSKDNLAFRLARTYGHQNVCYWLVATFGENVKV